MTEDETETSNNEQQRATDPSSPPLPTLFLGTRSASDSSLLFVDRDSRAAVDSSSPVACNACLPATRLLLFPFFLLPYLRGGERGWWEDVCFEGKRGDVEDIHPLSHSLISPVETGPQTTKRRRVEESGGGRGEVGEGRATTSDVCLCVYRPPPPHPPPPALLAATRHRCCCC